MIIAVVVTTPERIWPEYKYEPEGGGRMAIEISDEIKGLLQDKNTLKALASIDKDGVPHVVFKGSINLDEEGNLFFLELLETSQTNKNLTYSIWFDKKVAINLYNDKKSIQIKGTPKKVHITGRLFEEKYQEVRARNPKADLSGVWIITPEEIRTETFSERLEYEREHYPVIGHLDRDLK